MPVPVPARSPAHAVNKVLPPDASPPGLVRQSALKHLLNSLPEPPSGPPAAFTDRETWIKSLPPYRRYKLRQDAITHCSNMAEFNVTEQCNEVVKARSLSIVTFPSLNTGGMNRNATNIIVASTASPSVPLLRAHAPLSNGKPWPPSPPKAIKQAIMADERRKAVSGDATLTCDSGRDADDELSEEWTEDEAFFAGPTVHRQATVKKAPVRCDNKDALSDVSRPDSFQVSVPLAEVDSDVDVPMAPFDGTLAAGVVTSHLSDIKLISLQPVLNDSTHASANAPVKQPDTSSFSPARKAPSPVPTTITPSDMIVYTKKIAEPMSEWVAEYIWKVVTRGMSLPPEFIANTAGYRNSMRAHASKPPAYLADSIRTLLCSTLLQPSAIFLALWYIARLPVFFGVFAYDAKSQSKEFKFRLELLGEGSLDPGAEKTRQLLEAHAPFRLLLLGVMLANKWLDDNTFSNKTWHQVSGVPMRALNRLESLGLDLLSHDLSMLPCAWHQWLEHMQNYHRSLAPYPEPIGPPRDTPHVVIRRTIEELISAGSPPVTTGVLPEPVFLGLAERRKERERERLAKEELDLLSLDLDEDGPLREEYLPKRRKELSMTDKDKRVKEELERALPPPAEWSPAADPPIHRERPTYQAVQRPPPAPVPAHACAHVPKRTSHVSQANGYFDRISPVFPDVVVQGQLHVQGHVHRCSQGWPAPGGLKYSAQTAECYTFPPHANSWADPVYNVQCPALVAVNHSVSWSVPAPPVAQQPRVGSRYKPVSASDAPPTHLFRPTWLRT